MGMQQTKTAGTWTLACTCNSMRHRAIRATFFHDGSERENKQTIQNLGLIPLPSTQKTSGNHQFFEMFVRFLFTAILSVEALGKFTAFAKH